jgi:hypothetical protein
MGQESLLHEPLNEGGFHPVESDHDRLFDLGVPAIACPDSSKAQDKSYGPGKQCEKGEEEGEKEDEKGSQEGETCSRPDVGVGMTWEDNRKQYG